MTLVNIANRFKSCIIAHPATRLFVRIQPYRERIVFKINGTDNKKFNTKEKQAEGIMAHHLNSDSDSTYDPTQEDEPSSQRSRDLFSDDFENDESFTTDLKHLPGTSKQKVASKMNLSKSPTNCQRITHNISDSDSSDGEERLERGNSIFNDSARGPKIKTKCDIASSKSTLVKQDTLILDKKEITPSLPMCKYGSKCYRKNPSHFKEFDHPVSHASKGVSKRKSDVLSDDSPGPSKHQRLERRSSSSSKQKITLKNGAERFQRSSPLNFFLLKVEGIPQEYNQLNAIGIRDILDPSMGNLQKSVQFNYMFEIPWLVDKYPPKFRNLPLLLVHGFQRQDKASLDLAASAYDHIRLCQARLDMPYGTHHSKMMLLLYDDGMRVVITTANMVERDWAQKSQGAWLSPVFPKLSSGASDTKGDSATHFKHDLLEYLRAYKARPLEEWIDIVKQHDMSQTKVHLIASVPGRHIGEKKQCFGHLKLRKVLQQHGPNVSAIKNWPVIGQFSSIGSLGAQPELWLCGEWYTSLSSAKGGGTGMGGNRDKLKLIFPSKDNVRTSLEGYPAGASLPYSINVAKKQTYLHSFFHQWKSAVRGRSRASPHIKTYGRMSPDGSQLAWFAVTSANLSKAAWGALEKKGSQLMIRSYEIGVLYLPQYFGEETFKTMSHKSDSTSSHGGLVMPQPYDLPPVPYAKSDKPWIWDIAYTDLPDSHGNAWCPR